VRDVVGHAGGLEVEPLPDGADDAPVGLVVDEEVDVVELEARARDGGDGGEWPSISSTRLSCDAVMRSPSEPSAAMTIGPMSPSPSGPSTTAPAPSPNSIAVLGSSKFVMRVSSSAPITSTRSARPVSTWPAARRSAAIQPVQAAPMSIAPAFSAPSSLATTGAAFGVISSGVIVATSTRSTSRASTPASCSARRAANTA
jgi:hypothetical protein